MAKRTTLNSTDCYGRIYFRTRHYLSLQTTSHKPLVVKTRGRDFLCFFCLVRIWKAGAFLLIPTVHIKYPKIILYVYCC